MALEAPPGHRRRAVSAQASRSSQVPVTPSWGRSPVRPPWSQHMALKWLATWKQKTKKVASPGCVPENGSGSLGPGGGTYIPWNLEQGGPSDCRTSSSSREVTSSPGPPCPPLSLPHLQASPVGQVCSSCLSNPPTWPSVTSRAQVTSLLTRGVCKSSQWGSGSLSCLLQPILHAASRGPVQRGRHIVSLP